MSNTNVTILGAGPAGLGAAWRLREESKADVTIVEQNHVVGGNAGSFNVAGIPVDLGSHRLHPACEPRILDDLKDLLGTDLLDRPRHGRIRLKGKWIHFPLKPQDLVFNLPISFGLGVAIDAGVKTFRPNGNGHTNFATELEKGLGKTICRDFYFPYAEKIWGVEPNVLSAIQARRRVSAGSLKKLAGKVLSAVPGVKKNGGRRFYYPRQGYGQISSCIADRARYLGAELKLSSRVKTIELREPKRIVTIETPNGEENIEADHVWSTIPITALIRSIRPGPPSEVLESCGKISFRAMILVYIVLNEPRWTEYDAHYFPETEVKISRLSEPKNYGGRSEPKDKTVLCAEIPCSVDDTTWKASDEQMGAIVRSNLESCDLKITSEVLEVAVRRLPFAYPIYMNGYEEHFAVQDKWLGELERVLTFGRQGLFAHDNTHHALAMAYGAVDCLDSAGNFDNTRWHQYREEFATHVVED